MNNKPLHNKWLAAPACFLLLPVFFVAHGWQENFAFIPASEVALLLLIYLVAAGLLFGLSWLIFRDSHKAALASFSLMAIHFFFGGAHDLLKDIFDRSWITRYSVLLSVLAILIIFIFVSLKRRKRSLQKTMSYLNILMIILIVLDLSRLLMPGGEVPPEAETHNLQCDTCNKPDFYLILLDEYAGNDALKDLFAFDNLAFEQQLRQRGFFVASHSTSNYNYTPFSMASILNMQYLELDDTERKKPAVTHAFRLINGNKVTAMLTANGYGFYNHSVFDLPGRPAPIEESFIPARTRLITAQTLLSRLERDLGYHLVNNLQSVATKRSYRALRNNNKLYELTQKQAATPHAQPQFVYTHLMMPHYPYYYDRNGKPMEPARVLPEANNVNRKDYLEYLQFANHKILALADHILRTSTQPPVIIIMSDHGFRHFDQPVERKYHFMNLNAVYLPGQKYQGFYDSVSNVNQFRLIFNEVFRTTFPLLKDTSIYLKD